MIFSINSGNSFDVPAAVGPTPQTSGDNYALSVHQDNTLKLLWLKIVTTTSYSRLQQNLPPLFGTDLTTEKGAPANFAAT